MTYLENVKNMTFRCFLRRTESQGCDADSSSDARHVITAVTFNLFHIRTQHPACGLHYCRDISRRRSNHIPFEEDISIEQTEAYLDTYARSRLHYVVSEAISSSCELTRTD